MCKMNAHITLRSDIQQARTLIILCFHVAPKKTMYRIQDTVLIRIENKDIYIDQLCIDI